MSASKPEIFHEKQEGNLCAQHALNALLQGQYFTAVDLAEIAAELDQKEHLALAEGADSATLAAAMQGSSQNMDDSGFFSIQVITAALLRMGQIELLNWNHQSMKHVRTKPESAMAFICNQREHWFCIRRFGVNWFNLNSMLARPVHVNLTYLGMLLAQLENDGYSIFVVSGALPQSAADRMADKIDVNEYKEESKNALKKEEKPKVVPFSGAGQTIGATPSSSTTTTQEHMPFEQVNANEDPELAAAIAASLGQDSIPLPQQAPGGQDEDLDEDQMLQEALRMSKHEHDSDDPTLQALLRQTAAEAGADYVDDNDDLRRALAASLANHAAASTSVQTSVSGTQVAVTQQPNTAAVAAAPPTAEELRNRRAAFLDRFNAGNT